MLNIRTRLTFQFVCLVALILLGLSFGVFFFGKLYLQKRYFKRLQDRAITTATVLFDLQASGDAVLKLMGASDREPLYQENISVYDAGRAGLLFSTNPANLHFHQQIVPRLDSTAETTYLHQADYQVVAIPLRQRSQTNWIIVSGIDQGGREALSDLKKILVVMTLAAVLLLTVAGWFFASSALAPMASITRQVNAIFPNCVGKRVLHPNESDEIGRLVLTFNRLLDRIEQSLHAQRIFVANVSHELKNPLTKIQAQVDVALLQPRTPEAYETTLRSIQEDVRQLADLTTVLLELANISANSPNFSFELIRIDELLWEVKSQFEHWHAGFVVNLIFVDFPDQEEDLILLGNKPSLRVLLSNLFDNACKFSPDQTAHVAFRSEAGQVTVTVFNTGPPIPDGDLPFVFQPFFRGNATALGREGHGIGLAVVAEVARLHAGRIWVESSGEGTRFVLHLPRAIAI